MSAGATTKAVKNRVDLDLITTSADGGAEIECLLEIAPAVSTSARRERSRGMC